MYKVQRESSTEGRHQVKGDLQRLPEGGMLAEDLKEAREARRWR